MANTIHIDIVSAEGEVHSGLATMVFAPASGGEVGIAPRHAPLLTTLKPGEVRVQTESGEELLFWVGGGALEDCLHAACRIVVVFTNHQRIELAARGVERVNRRIDTKRGDLAREYDGRIEMREGRRG